MSAGLAEQTLTGVQTPRLSWMPAGEWDWSLGDECVTWARETLGVFLDPWEQLVLRMMLARRPDGRWACPEFGLLVSRRNGKSHVLVVRFLFGLLVLGNLAIEYTAHHGKTVRETFRIAVRILDAAPTKFEYHPYRSAGREEIQFDDGKRKLAFSTRTASAGRGTGADVLAVDEAQEADDEEMDALTPILGDRSLSGNPQLIFAGSSGNFKAVVFGRIRRSALSGQATRLGWAEWSIDDLAYFAADVEQRILMATSVESIAQANPSLGIMRPDGSGGLALDWLRGQIDLLSASGFAREHLGVGTWPKDDGQDWVIPRARWGRAGFRHLSGCRGRACPGCVPLPAGALVLAISAAWHPRTFAIAAAGGLDGACYGWLERLNNGSDWVIADLLKLVGKTQTAAVLLDDGSPAAPLADEIEQALKPTGVPLHRLGVRDTAQAYGAMSDAVTSDPPTFLHRDDPDVNAGLAGTAKKDVGSGLWVFDRAKSQSDIAPLEALAIARHGWVTYGQETDSVYEERGLITL